MTLAQFSAFIFGIQKRDREKARLTLQLLRAAQYDADGYQEALDSFKL